MGRKEFKFTYVDKMTAYTHGGSLRTTIPAEVVGLLGLISGDEVAFFKEENLEIALIMKAKKGKIGTSFGEIPLAFSISKEMAKKLLSKKD